MKEIKLTQGKFTQVDDDLFDYLNQWKWFAVKSKRTYYAERCEPVNHSKKIKMHRVIMNTPQDMQVDHIDHNGLNNQKCNLRNCTSSQNAMNRTPRGSRKYLGVSVLIDNKYIRIQAQIRANGKYMNLGAFKTEEDAARAYDAKAKELFGEFANLNFK